MEWSEEESAELFVVWFKPFERERDRAEAVASRAVELAAARGGTMTARDAKELRTGLVDGTGIPHVRECLAAALDDLSILGARNAVLEAERDDLRLRLTALEVAGAKLSAHVDKTAGQESAEDAMRAACILIVDEEMMTDGLSGCPIHRRIKERMEGAAT